MNQWNLVIDVARCENCNNCVLANKDEFVGNDFGSYSAPHALHGAGTIAIQRRVRGEAHMVDAAYLPTMCNHCDDAPCIKAAGADVIRKRPDGIVIIDPVKAKGRKDLVQACPYGAIVWNEEQQLPQNWIFDAHLLDGGWQEPRCAQSCPTDAIKAYKTDAGSMAQMVATLGLEVLQPELNSRPRVYYQNLYRYAKHFLGGTVVCKVNGALECIEDARVTLVSGGATLQEVTTDAFGDFKFDGLEARSSPSTVRVAHQLFGTLSVSSPVGTTCVLGEIELPPFVGLVPKPPGRHDAPSQPPRRAAEGEPVAVAMGAGSAA